MMCISALPDTVATLSKAAPDLTMSTAWHSLASCTFGIANMLSFLVLSPWGDRGHSAGFYSFGARGLIFSAPCQRASPVVYCRCSMAGFARLLAEALRCIEMLWDLYQMLRSMLPGREKHSREYRGDCLAESLSQLRRCVCRMQRLRHGRFCCIWSSRPSDSESPLGPLS